MDGMVFQASAAAHMAEDATSDAEVVHLCLGIVVNELDWKRANDTWGDVPMDHPDYGKADAEMQRIADEGRALVARAAAMTAATLAGWRAKAAAVRALTRLEPNGG